MLPRVRSLCFPVFLLILVGTLAFVVVRSTAKRHKQPILHEAASTVVTGQTSLRRSNNSVRNLSMQPEALAMSRRLGKRFSPEKRVESTLTGMITIAGTRQEISTKRRQTDDGEQVEIALAGAPGLLTWDRLQGSATSDRRASATDRELVERLVLDSPDQFVLAQLAGASYQVIARNLRASDNGDDGYSGALWKVVRVDYPRSEGSVVTRPGPRLYYINMSTGLIDRVVRELQGEQLVASFDGWTNLNGEKCPTEITWSRNGQVVMRYRLTNFSHTAQ